MSSRVESLKEKLQKLIQQLKEVEGTSNTQAVISIKQEIESVKQEINRAEREGGYYDFPSKSDMPNSKNTLADPKTNKSIDDSYCNGHSYTNPYGINSDNKNNSGFGYQM